MSFMEDPFEQWMLAGMSPFGGMRAGPSFPIDVEEKGNEYIVYAALPGINPQKVNVQAQDNTLRISGDIPEEKPKEPGHWLLLERPTGHFERTVTFPTNIAAGQAQAEFRNGTLVIELPKAPAGREIPIGTGQQAIQQGQQTQY